MAYHDHLQARLGGSLFALCLCLGLLISPDHTVAQSLAGLHDNSETFRPFTRGRVAAVKGHKSENVWSFESAIRGAAAADTEAAKALAEYEDAKKVLAAKKLEAEGIIADASEARSEAEGMKLEQMYTDMDVAEISERARKRCADLKLAEEVAEKAAAFLAEKLMAADEAVAEAGKAARLAEVAGTAEARLAFVRTEAARSEAAEAAEEAKRIAEATKENAEEFFEACSHEEADLEVSTVDLETEKTYIEDLDSAAARGEEEYRKSVTAVRVAQAKVAELKGLAEEKIARAKAMRVALRNGGKGTGRNARTATQ